ncbi:Pectate lyase [Phytophthora infestans]|uniref:Probable pectate lyase F n=1 Tax=Phytophthora infestans TaxID=4787 RepID=A0A833S5E7_PHYIN|nr:Pectate lyase [Phytophthora infestans]
MVKIRTGTVVSVVALLGFALSITGADDSWGGMAQYAANSHEQQPTDAPVILEGTGSKESEDDQKPADNDDDTTDAPSNSWSPASSNEDSDNDTPDASRESSGESDDNGDKPSSSPSSREGQSSNENANGNKDGSSNLAGRQPNRWQYPPSSGGGKVPDGTWPASTRIIKFTEPRIIKAGEVFDGKMQTFDRSDVTCSEGEGQKDTAVFLVEAGGTLKNAIIGKNQKEGVHCDDHDCTIENVWWDDVCEDALSVKGGTASSVTTVTNCGARSASDKVVQHNGQGTVNIDGFYAEEFGKHYRSCGTCGDVPRIVTIKNVYAVDPQVSVITVSKNYGDKATLSNIWVKTSDGSNEVKVCQWSQGGAKPLNLGDGPSPPLCQYSESDVHINQDISESGASSPSAPSAPDKPSDGSNTSQQSQKTQTPVDSKDSSDKNEDDSETEDSSGDSETPPNGSQTSSDAPETPPSGGQTSGATPAAGSQTTAGGGSTPSSGGGKVPDGTWPTSTGSVQFTEAHVIKAGEIFDGKMQTFERSDISCEGQTESGSDTAVFMMEPGATLKNAIIGKNQMEGWDDVCEDALSIKGGTASSVSKVIGGGARSADDKVIQHNGYGTVEIDGFYGEDISKLYRSCGTCGDRPKKVSVSNVYIVNPGNAVVTVNKNWGDEATLSNIWVKSSGKKKVKICQGNADGEPSMLGDGPSPPLCQ